MVAILAEAKPEARIREFAGKFGREQYVIQDSVNGLRARCGVGWDVVRSLISLVESSFVDGKPHDESSSRMFIDAACIIKNVVKGDQDKRGSAAVIKFMETATAIASMPEQQMHQASVISGMWEFTAVLSVRKSVTDDDVQDIFKSTTELLDAYLRQGNVEDAVRVSKGMLPAIARSESPESIKDIIVGHLVEARMQTLRGMEST